MSFEPIVAYFSMEIALESQMPTYAGGLGVLAGDTLRSAADLEVPMVGVTLVHRAGYFEQQLDAAGRQHEAPAAWPIAKHLERVDARVAIDLSGRRVLLTAWRYHVIGVSGFELPVYLLDADLPENDAGDRRLTDALYGGDETMRLCQEAVLGLGGIALLRALGYAGIERYHLNEGHAALIVLALLEERLAVAGSDEVSPEQLAAMRDLCVFTTHTPVPAGHDQFEPELVERVLGARRARRLESLTRQRRLNMTDLALHGSGFVNGVAMSHWEVSRDLYPDYKVHAITNGVHVRTWASAPFQALYDRWLPDWRRDCLSLRYAIRIPCHEIWRAHQEVKRALVERVNRETDARFDPEVCTLGFARRATAYKRTALVFSDLERLRKLARERGGLQLVFAGKAHPRDEPGKQLIRAVHEVRDALRGQVPVAYLANHDMELGRLLCAGADVWLNTPLPPLEASGTSGMKAAVNGVPSLSVLDGWFVEGHIEGHTGWSIGDAPCARETLQPEGDAADARALYDKLEAVVLPCFYRTPEAFHRTMRSTISINASFFNTDRMLAQYLHAAYRIGLAPRLAHPRVS
jgi:starch phosphorylase